MIWMLLWWLQWLSFQRGGCFMDLHGASRRSDSRTLVQILHVQMQKGRILRPENVWAGGNACFKPQPVRLVVRHALPSWMRCQRSRTPTDFEQNSDGESGGGEQWGSDLIDSAAVHLEIKVLHASCGKAWHNVVWGTIGATLGRYEVFVAEGAPMPSIAQRDKYVSGVPRWECHGRVGIPQTTAINQRDEQLPRLSSCTWWDAFNIAAGRGSQALHSDKLCDNSCC
jgi:hypothetical protein